MSITILLVVATLKGGMVFQDAVHAPDHALCEENAPLIMANDRGKNPDIVKITHICLDFEEDSFKDATDVPQILPQPKFDHAKDEASGTDLKIEPIEGQRTKIMPAGSLEKVDKYYGRTIAGGPGSQRIGDTFMALPKEEREAMIAARKGVIRQLRPNELCGDQHEDPYVWRGSTRSMSAAIGRRTAQVYDRDGAKVVPKPDDLARAVERARGDTNPPTVPVRFACDDLIDMAKLLEDE